MTSRLQDLVDVGLANPFSPHRDELLRRALGRAWVDDRGERVLVRKVSVPNDANFERWGTLLEERLRATTHAATGVPTWSAAVLMLGYVKLGPSLSKVVLRARAGEDGRVEEYERFLSFWNSWAQPGSVSPALTPAHAFALLFQLRRAFDTIFDHVVGGASEAARVRAETWESLFTRDLLRYAEVLYARMGTFATLITGPSGSGKELVATALGHSRYVPFDEASRRFVANPFRLHQAINVAGFAPTLVESELFGHVRGAYTGAVAARVGWLEQAGAWGSVFLDEIGELDPSLQVKLLRVLQARTFSRLGESTERRFDGKVIAATNRDLASAQAAGAFRSDLFYRLNSDVIRTPGLAAQLREDDTELDDLVRFVASKLVGERPDLVDELTLEATHVIRATLGPAYEWPGNFRELEQCVRNILVRGSYSPARAETAQGPAALVAALDRALDDASLGFEELGGATCYAARRRCGSWVEAAKRLALDRRTVQRKATAFARRVGLPVFAR